MSIIEHLENEIEKLREENERLKKLCRIQFITLGYYGTHYNYDQKNIVYHPISGEPASGIMHDGGQDARQASAFARALGFTGDEISAWPGPGDIKLLYGDELEAEYAAWYENQTGKKLEARNPL